MSASRWTESSCFSARATTSTCAVIASLRPSQAVTENKGGDGRDAGFLHGD